ncbi:hypothetical protein CKO_02262 [Citrobacter koseri ATCC BAA-895]|uniref:Uncharacterized protein n=1 Tax=Citrobacter koseri (strain ATCC BAA-895 / CDC 4225-83 / SGSC4696) TaxID=290338 RepID=A8AIS2_CITK8|nr:hypothetical protein CKO_02262 [Citrobacter koseri ATCC BAA-895]
MRNAVNAMRYYRFLRGLNDFVSPQGIVSSSHCFSSHHVCVQMYTNLLVLSPVFSFFSLNQ